MVYSPQSGISWRPQDALSQMSIIRRTCRRGGKRKFGVVITPILKEGGCGCWLRMTTDAHGAKEMQIELSQQLFNCDDVKGSFDKDSKFCDGIFDMKMLKQNMRDKLEGSA